MNRTAGVPAGRLTQAGEFLVQRGLKRLLQDYHVTWPVNCFALTNQIRQAGKIPLAIVKAPLPEKGFEAVTALERNGGGEQGGRYFLFIKPVPPDWREQSALRRVHFSIAHELGHIFCRHLEETPGAVFSNKLSDKEEAEADEFAGRLLMPEALLASCRARTLTGLADYFLVSNQCLRTRLDKLGRLDLFSGPFRDVCARCGNDRLNPGAEWCDICGAQLSGPQARQGVLMIGYDRSGTDRLGRMLRCPVCGNGEFSSGAMYCRRCGTPAYNRCDDVLHLCGHANSPEARFCEKCGAQTLFSKLGILPDPKQEREEWIREIMNSQQEREQQEKPGIIWPNPYEPDPDTRICPFCGKRQHRSIWGNCIACGKHMGNRCTGKDRHYNRGNALFCEVCGARCAYADIPFHNEPDTI